MKLYSSGRTEISTMNLVKDILPSWKYYTTLVEQLKDAGMLRDILKVNIPSRQVQLVSPPRRRYFNFLDLETSAVTNSEILNTKEM